MSEDAMDLRTLGDNLNAPLDLLMDSMRDHPRTESATAKEDAAWECALLAKRRWLDNRDLFFSARKLR